MKLLGAVIWQTKQVALGSGQVSQFTLFEHKRLLPVMGCVETEPRLVMEFQRVLPLI